MDNSVELFRIPFKYGGDESVNKLIADINTRITTIHQEDGQFVNMEWIKVSDENEIVYFTKSMLQKTYITNIFNYN